MTKKVFRITIASFFVSNFMMLLGSVIDGFVVGNNMDANRIAAIGLASPAVILFAVIGAVAGSSFQGRSLRCLNRGDVDGAGRALTRVRNMRLFSAVKM